MKSVAANKDAVKTVRIALIARSEAEKTALEGKIEGVKVVVVNESTGNASDVIRGAFDNKVSRMPTYEVGRVVAG